MDSGLKITPNHPIINNGKWIYPSQLVNPVIEKCDAVYNLIVETNHVAIINGTHLILLGHDLQEGILRDEYLGNIKITKDMQSMKGWKSGYVHF